MSTRVNGGKPGRDREERHDEHLRRLPGRSPWRPVEGCWRTVGRVVGEQETSVIGSDVYALFPGGHLLVHHVDVPVGEQPVRAIDSTWQPWLHIDFERED